MNYSLDQQKISFKVITNEITISNSQEVLHKLTGISVIPAGIRIEPLKIKEDMIRKSEDKSEIEKQLFEGNYFVNIIDYTLGEISVAANLLCEKWADLIWKHLISTKDDFLTVTLKNNALRKQLVKLNPEIFKKEKDVTEFCKKYNFKVEKLIEIAKFNQLEIELENIAARLSSEIIFFRKKLFTEVLLQKIDKKIYDFEKNQPLIIPQANKEIYLNWRNQQLRDIQLVQKYIKSPFTFEDLDQYSNYKSLNDFSTNNISQQEQVAETLYWIENFPKSKKRFEIAVKHYGDQNNYRDSIDNLRLTLELLLKDILQNNKSLENQLSEISKYQKDLGIGAEIRNTFEKTLDYYNKFQNNKVKHADEVDNFHEVEFIFGLTMLFIRMLIKPNDKFRIQNLSQ